MITSGIRPTNLSVDLTGYPTSEEMNAAIDESAGRNLITVDTIDTVYSYGNPEALAAAKVGETGTVAGTFYLSGNPAPLVYDLDAGEVVGSGDPAAPDGFFIKNGFAIRLGSDDLEYEWSGTEWAAVDPQGMNQRVTEIENTKYNTAVVSRSGIEALYQANSGRGDEQGFINNLSAFEPESGFEFAGQPDQNALIFDASVTTSGGISGDLHSAFLYDMLEYGGSIRAHMRPMASRSSDDAICNFTLLAGSDHVPQTGISDGRRMIAFVYERNGKVRISIGEPGVSGKFEVTCNGVNLASDGVTPVPDINMGDELKLEMVHRGGEDLGSSTYAASAGGLSQIQFDVYVNGVLVGTTPKGTIFTASYNLNNKPYLARTSFSIWDQAQIVNLYEFGLSIFTGDPDLTITSEMLSANSIQVIGPYGYYDLNVYLERGASTRGATINLALSNVGDAKLFQTTDGTGSLATFNSLKSYTLMENNRGNANFRLISTQEGRAVWVDPEFMGGL